MEIFVWAISILLLAVLIYYTVKPYLKGLDYSRIKQPDFSIEEVLEKPAPKKRKPYKKRKPKNDKGEK
jgi:heme/copper-type cytochrome/quinol oxidase subunit 2